MKFLVVFVLAALAVAAHAVSEEEKEQIKQLAATCLTESGVTKDLIVKARAHEYTGRDPQLAAYYSCMLGKMQFQRKDGTFDVDRMAEKLPGNVDKETAVKAVKKCANADTTLTKDDNAMTFMYCFYKEVGKNFKLY